MRITEQIIASVEEFKKNLEHYQNGEIDNFKSFSSYMGIYKQRLSDTYMVRPRIPGGVITLEQLNAISNIAKQYAKSKIRFTTRQDIQFHSVEIDDLGNVLDDLLKCGLTTLGAGGDSVRNVACSPLSGVAQDDVFDVTPYMKKVANYMMEDPANLKLPRKYKISFSNSREDTANATVADIGFIAKMGEGKRGFEVYGGGGLGSGARIGLKLEDFIEDTEALYYVQAMKQVFEREGDRANRNRARLRFVVQKLGEEGFIQLFKSELEKLKSVKNLKISIDSKEEIIQNARVKLRKTYDKKYENVLFPQKQEGYYSLYIHPQNGNMSTNDLDKVVDFLESLEYQISVRLTLTQGFFVRDLKDQDVKKLLEIISAFSELSNINKSITCAGPTICNFGINNSQGLLSSIVKAFKDVSTDLQGALPKLMISGCHNSCGQHQKGLIGFTGKRRRIENVLIPMYSVSFNGRVGSNITRFGEVYGEIPTKKIPNFLLELAHLKINSGYLDFVEFIENRNEDVRTLVTQYSTIESFKENQYLYSDFE